ncbi:MAG: hypothetical protein Ct9H300mP16_15410 [Pseudomonadota bacterium]|nr:MAG: hypothetical protein Ct9H300mP16_15410 [Pseudomonadota bacterium]
MRIAFCLFEYSPYSGLSLDFRRILQESLERGHDAHVFVRRGKGKGPMGFRFTFLPPGVVLKHTKNKQILCPN